MSLISNSFSPTTSLVHEAPLRSTTQPLAPNPALRPLWTGSMKEKTPLPSPLPKNSILLNGGAAAAGGEGGGEGPGLDWEMGHVF